MEPGIRIPVFDARINQKLLATLRRMEHPDGSNNAAMMVYFARADSVDSLVKHGRALARTTSNSAGRFHLSFNPMDSVVVYAYDEREDEPFYYTYRVIGGRVSQSIMLEMSGTPCHR